MGGLLAGTAYIDITPKMDNFGAALRAEVAAVTRGIAQFTAKDLEGSFAGLGAAASQLGGTLTKGISVPLIGAGLVVSKFAMDFNREMANVATLIPGNTARVGELKTAIQDMAVEVGTSTGDLAGGLYQVISAFGDTADTVTILDTNARAAKAGVASTTEAINLTSAVTKAYGDTSADAVTHVADLALKTVELGQTTFPELAGAIGLVTPLAASLGVTVEDLFGTMATFSGVTGSASEVSTQLRGVLQALLAPTDAMTDLFAQLGVSSGEALIAQHGLAGATQLIVAAAQQSGRPLQDYIGSIEGQTLALAGAGGQADAWTDKVGQMADTAGTLDEKFKTMTEGVGDGAFTLEQAKAAAEVAAQRLGDALAPAIGVVMRDLVPLAASTAEFAASLLTMDGVLGTAARGLAAIAVAAGPTLWAVGKISSGISSLIGFARSAKDALTFFRLGLAGVTEKGTGAANALGGFLGSAGLGGSIGVIGGVTVALGFAANALRQHAARAAEARRLTAEFTAALVEDTGALGANTTALILNRLEEHDQTDDLARLQDHLASGRQAFDVFADAVMGSIPAQQEFRRAMLESGEVSIDVREVHEGSAQAIRDEWIRTGGDIMDVARQYHEESSTVVTGNIGLADSLDSLSTASDSAMRRMQDGIEIGARDTDGKIAAAAATDDLTQASAAAADESEHLSRAFGRVGSEADEVSDTLDRFQTALDGLLGLHLDVESAELRWRDSLAELADTVAENGNTLDASTEKGRANRQAMIDCTDSALAWAEAIVTQTGNTDAANLVLGAHADALVNTATQAGLSGQAALDYAADLLGIPTARRSEITNTADLARVAAESYQRQLDGIPSNITTTVELDLRAMAQSVADAISALSHGMFDFGADPDDKGGWILGTRAAGGNDPLGATLAAIGEASDQRDARRAIDAARASRSAGTLASDDFLGALVARVSQQQEFERALRALSGDGRQALVETARRAGLSDAEINQLLAAAPPPSTRSSPKPHSDDDTKSVGRGSRDRDRPLVVVEKMYAWDAAEAAHKLRREFELAEIAGQR